MTTVLNLPKVNALLSSEHFSVDGTLIEAWASMKSFVPKDGSATPPARGSDPHVQRLEKPAAGLLRGRYGRTSVVFAFQAALLCDLPFNRARKVARTAASSGLSPSRLSRNSFSAPVFICSSTSPSR